MRTSPAGVHGEEQDARVVHRPTLSERRLPPLVTSILPRAVEAAFLGPLHVLRHQLLGVLPAAADGDDARGRARLGQQRQKELCQRERRQCVRRKVRLKALGSHRPVGSVSGCALHKPRVAPQKRPRPKGVASG